MNCSEARNLLSAYLDGELSTDSRTLVVAHLEACSECAGELAAFQRLSQMAAGLGHPEAPPEIWEGVTAELDSKVTPPLSGNRTPSGESSDASATTSFRWLSLAAMILLAVTLGFLGHPSRQHDEMSADFSEYLDAFQQTPADAHLVLVNKYGGRTVDLERAQSHLGYRPVLADGLPDRYSIQTSYAMDMPCCKCIKCVCERADGGTLAILEHNDQQPIWFGDRISVEVECGGKECTVIQLNGHIAVSWKHGSRHLTVVGAKDMKEASQLVKHLSAL